MSLYNKQGLLNGYKKNNKEREALDYYATPTTEVINILNTINEKLKIDISNDTILEPCCGGGHMVEGIIEYCGSGKNIICTDIKDRGYSNLESKIEYNLDFLDDNYPYSNVDTIVMNPPYSTIEPFLIRALEIYDKNLIVLCRTQVLEGEGRFNNIFSTNPPDYIFQYVDRIKCYKNGDFSDKESSAQAYCWLIWSKNVKQETPKLYWLRRFDKIK